MGFYPVYRDLSSRRTMFELSDQFSIYVCKIYFLIDQFYCLKRLVLLLVIYKQVELEYNSSPRSIMHSEDATIGQHRVQALGLNWWIQMYLFVPNVGVDWQGYMYCYYYK